MGATKGSKDPNNRVLAPKYHCYSSFWALKPCYLGPWTLRGYIKLLCPSLLPVGNSLVFCFFGFG